MSAKLFAGRFSSGILFMQVGFAGRVGDSCGGIEFEALLGLVTRLVDLVYVDVFICFGALTDLSDIQLLAMPD